MCFSGSKNSNLVLIYCQNAPHSLNISFGRSPIAFGIKVGQIKIILEAFVDPRVSKSDFTGNQVLTAERTLVIKKNTVASKNIKTLAIINRNPISV